MISGQTSVSWSRTPRAVHREVLDGALVARVEGGDLVELNETGAALWRELAIPGTVPQLADRLASEFDAPTAEVAAGIMPVIEVLHQRGLLERSGP